MLQQVSLKVITKEHLTKDGKRKFNTYYTPVSIIVKGEEEKGLQDKFLTVKFRDNLKPKMKVALIDAMAYVPYQYEVKETEEGKVFPFIFIEKILNESPVQTESKLKFRN